MSNFESEFARLAQILADLRAPNGCPWDREQTHASLRPYLLEESAEVLEAIERGDARNLCEELGDLVLQVVFHAQIAQENGDFTLEDVLRGINEKLVRRHPHVFGETSVSDAGEVLTNWDAIKKQEKAARGEAPKGILDGVSGELSALSGALKISKTAAKIGFEWPDEESVWEKVREEEAEFRAARAESSEREAEEFGDLLFTLVNVARWRKIHPETALRDVNAKFRARFSHMESEANRRGWDLETLSPAQWEQLWTAAKNRLAGGVTFVSLD